MYKSIACLAFQSTAFQRTENDLLKKLHVYECVSVWIYSVGVYISVRVCENTKRRYNVFFKVGLSSINNLTIWHIRCGQIKVLSHVSRKGEIFLDTDFAGFSHKFTHDQQNTVAWFLFLAVLCATLHYWRWTMDLFCWQTSAEPLLITLFF